MKIPSHALQPFSIVKENERWRGQEEFATFVQRKAMSRNNPDVFRWIRRLEVSAKLGTQVGIDVLKELDLIS